MTSKQVVRFSNPLAASTVPATEQLGNLTSCDILLYGQQWHKLKFWIKCPLGDEVYFCYVQSLKKWQSQHQANLSHPELLFNKEHPCTHTDTHSRTQTLTRARKLSTDTDTKTNTIMMINILMMVAMMSWQQASCGRAPFFSFLFIGPRSPGPIYVSGCI